MANLPADLGYTPEHEWVKLGPDLTARVGITDHATAALGDIVFVSLPSVGEAFKINDPVAELESTKSVSGVFSPLSGVVSQVNQALTEAPETINADPYGAGWLFELDILDQSELTSLLDASGYAALLA